MNKVIVAVIAFASLFIISCNTETKKVEDEELTITPSPEETGLTAEKANNYFGTYVSTLPCPDEDCQVELSLELLPDYNFVYSTQRIGIDKEAMFTAGTYHFEKDGNTLVLNEIANVPNAFLVGDNEIYQLDEKQQRIGGPNAEQYILKKSK